MKRSLARARARDGWIALLVVMTVAACARRGSQAVAPETRPAAPEARAERPPPSAVGECNARLVTRTSAAPGGHRVDAVVQNVSGAPLRFAVPSRCPRGVAAFEGLTAGYDYYGACAMGACVAPQPPRSFTIPPGGEVVVASATIHEAGSSCQPALSAGAHTLAFSVPGADGLDVCAVDRGVIEVRPRAAERTDPPPARPRRDCPAIACACVRGVPAPTPPGECPTCNCAEGPLDQPPPAR